jgi:hypothetical protein
MKKKAAMLSRHVWDVGKGVLGNAIFAALMAALGIGGLIFWRVLTQTRLTLEVSVLHLIILIILGLGFAFAIFCERRPMRVYTDRENAMNANTLILDRYSRSSRTNYVYSTRVTLWPPNEPSDVRRTFRASLTSIIESGVEVRRLWYLRAPEDIERLLFYFKSYKAYDNYSVKFLIGTTSLLPEILCVSGRVASISIPDKSAPRQMTHALHFFGGDEIKAWEGLFDILWDQAVSLKVGEKIYESNLTDLERRLVHESG